MCNVAPSHRTRSCSFYRFIDFVIPHVVDRAPGTSHDQSTDPEKTHVKQWDRERLLRYCRGKGDCPCYCIQRKPRGEVAGKAKQRWIIDFNHFMNGDPIPSGKEKRLIKKRRTTRPVQQNSSDRFVYSHQFQVWFHWLEGVRETIQYRLRHWWR